LNVECAAVSHEDGPNFAEAWMFAVERAPVQAMHIAPEIEAFCWRAPASTAVKPFHGDI
jgi:hypothetical protein